MLPMHNRTIVSNWLILFLHTKIIWCCFILIVFCAGFGYIHLTLVLHNILICYINCYFVDFMVDNVTKVTCDSWCSKTLAFLLNDDSTHDVTFKTSDGGSVSAHRAIVAAGSPVFHAMLYGNMKESSQKEIELPNIDSIVLKKLFCFIYSGEAQANLMEYMELLQAADYFDISQLKTICLDVIGNEMVLKFKFNNLICRNITIYAVKHQFDPLVQSCVSLMENNAGSIVYSLWFGCLPFSVLTMFVKSSNLEVRELDLFLAIVEWCKQHNDAISDDDVKSLFQHIRYPLMQKNDLIEKVRPTYMADPDLYKAALEYHDTDKFDGPEDQLKPRMFYFDFEAMEDDIKMEQTAKGTILTNDGPATFVTCVTKIFFKDSLKVPFTFCLNSCRNKRETLVKLYDVSHCIIASNNVVKLPIGEKVQGIILHGVKGISVNIGNLKLSIAACGELCEFGIRLYIGDQVHILRT